MTEHDLLVTIVANSLIMLLVVVLVVTLLVINTNRRHRHRAELVELRMHRDQELMQAEREATQHTMQEVGHELHDNVGQMLVFAQMSLNRVLEHAPDARLFEARDAVESSMEEVRRLAHGLSTDLWQDRTLVDAIDAEAIRLDRVGRVKAQVVVEGDPAPLSAEHSTILFRVFQEVISNAIKHSRADSIGITIHAEPLFSITITDNGAGFDPSLGSAVGGLRHIPKRCALIGYEARCDSTPGGGCTWLIKPMSSDAA